MIYSENSTKLTCKMRAILKKQDVKLLCLKAMMLLFVSCLLFSYLHQNNGKRENIQQRCYSGKMMERRKQARKREYPLLYSEQIKNSLYRFLK